MCTGIVHGLAILLLGLAALSALSGETLAGGNFLLALEAIRGGLYVIAAGGGTSTGEPFTLQGTIG
ncbi:MAG: hypothetical protein RML36_16775 [Anaerolineae bacterium]|nr:hypothetical protein [Anaerolineae bacterium]